MAKRQRSPFGELVRTYRDTQNLTQGELIDRIRNRNFGALSLRTLNAIEQARLPHDRWPRPYPATVDTLARAFGLKHGTAAWRQFMLAARINPSTHPPDHSAHGGRDRSNPPIETPLFVEAGRQPHLARLERAIDHTVNGSSGLLFVSATGGGGKTSLIAHALRQAIDRCPDLVVLWGECTSRASDADPLQPFRQVLSVMAGEVEAAHPQHMLSAANRDRIVRRLPIALEALVNDGSGLPVRLVPANTLLEQLESVPLDPGLGASLAAMLANPTPLPQAAGLHDQVCRVLSRYAAAGPVVLVLEDLHWSDDSSAALLWALIRHLRDRPIPLLVIGSYRPMELSILSESQQASMLRIVGESTRFFDDPVVDLSSAVGGEAGLAFTSAFASASIEAAPQPFIDSLFRVTGGHPLFVEGMLSLYGAGNLPSGEHPLEHRDPAQWPTKITALFANLISMLPEPLQNLLDAASVQGSVFAADVVGRVLGWSHADLIAHLDATLVHRYEVIRPAGATSVNGKRYHNYRIGHDLLRDFLYHRLTERQREHYHAETARAMVDLFGNTSGEVSGRIAFHFDQAHLPVDAGEHYLQAANAALELHDYARTRSLCQRILDLNLTTTRPFLPAQALVGLGNCDRGEGLIPQAREHFDQALAMADLWELPHVRANAHTSLGMLDFDAGYMRQGADRLQQAVTILLDFGDRAEASRSLALLSHSLHGYGHYDEAAMQAREAIALAQTLNNDLLAVSGTIAHANCFLELGLYNKAIRMYERCLVACNDHHDLHRAAICWLNIALCRIEMKEWDRATTSLEPVFDHYNEINRRLASAAEFHLALVDEAAGDLDSARDRFQQSLALRLQYGQFGLAVDSQAGLLRIAVAQNRLDAAQSLTAEIEDHLDRLGADGIEHPGRLYIALAHAWTALNEPERSRHSIRRGLAILSERSAFLADAAHRHAYLTNVPSHRELLRLAEDAGIAWNGPAMDETTASGA